jgi:peptide/nickel transport system substrate-binding protein
MQKRSLLGFVVAGCIFAAGMAGLAGVGCRRKAPAAAATDTLNRHLDGDPATLDPIVTAEELGILVEDLIFRPLIGIDKERRFVPSIATSWAASSDGLVYDIRLDPRVRWEDGTAVTSEDVAYTIDRVRDPKIAAVNWKWGFEDVRSIETPDPTTVIVKFAKPHAERLLAFTLPVVSAAAYRKGAGLDRQPVGSGPYRLESWTANQRIVLVRRTDADPASAAFARVVFRVIPDGAVRFRAGAAGELDEFRISRDQNTSVAGSKEFAARVRILKVPQLSVALLRWNLKNPLFADRRVRLALAHCWDRAEAAKLLYPPDGAALLSGPYPAGLPEDAPDVKPVSYDPAESERLLDAAGYLKGPDGIRKNGDRRMAFEILYPGSQAISKTIAEIFRTAAKKIGVDATLRPLDWAAYTTRFAAGEFDVAPTGQVFIPPHLDQYTYFHSSEVPPKGENTGFYRNPEADRALEAARRETDPAKRLELDRQVHRILAADAAADFLWSADQFWGISTRVENVETSPLGLFHFLPGPFGWKPAPPKTK